MTQGGHREGAGRPPEENPATKLATIKMTPEQHAKFLEVGGSRFLKRMLDALNKPDGSSTLKRILDALLTSEK